MIRKLQIKFVAMCMILVTAVLGVVFTAVFFSAKQNIEVISHQVLERVIQDDAPNSRPALGPNQNGEEVLLPYFTVNLWDSNGVYQAFVTSGTYANLQDTAELEDILSDCLRQGQPEGTIGSYGLRYMRQDYGLYQRIAFVDMSIAGRITGLRKPFDRGRQTYAFAAGTQKLYDFINNNPECMAAPVSYVNDIARVSQIDNFISINGAVDIDLYGQVSSESSGTHHISGAGGQQDFVMGAYLSKGGKSFICCSSSYMDKKSGQLKSRIRPTLLEGSVVTATRTNLHYVVTEYGKFNAKGKSTWERAEGLISIAHPQFREELIAEAEKMHIWRRSNKR